MSTSHWRGRVLAVAAALAAVLAIGVAPVLAHAEFVSSDPADGTSLATPPATITLTFSEGLNAAKSTFSVNQNGSSVATGKAASDGATTMTATGLSLGPGAYVIRWTSVAADGDLLRGTVTFTVLAAAPSASSAPPSAEPSAAASAAPSASATAAPSAAISSPSPQASSDATPASSSGSDVLLPIVLALLVVAGVGAFVLRRSRRV